MRIVPKRVEGWPKLAWVARFADGQTDVQVHCGPMVEVGPDWCAEAVWAGDFAEGDFDRTDLVFGSGVRCREGQVLFVSSGSTLDRLCYCRHEGTWTVSNSLPALLAAARLSLRDDYPDYTNDIKTICSGLEAHKRSLPADPADVHLAYFNNLLYDGQELKETPKPDTAPNFRSYDGYYGYLVETARRLDANLRSPARAHAVCPLVSISSGYDSPAAAVIGKQVGWNQTATIRQSTSLWRGSDSGEGIARMLGLSCRAYNRTAAYYPHEEAIWAVTGRPGIVNWAQFDYPEPLCLFVTACFGDKVWDRTCQQLSDVFVMPSIAQMGFGEFRLIKGVFHCLPTFWGMRHLDEIREITYSLEMAPWTLGTDYDRPIPRRIVEQAGVPRAAFAVRKKNTSTEAQFLWPHSPDARASFEQYLRDRGRYVPSRPTVDAIRVISHGDILLHRNVLKRLGLKRGPRPWLMMRSQSLLFQWANASLKTKYQNAL